MKGFITPIVAFALGLLIAAAIGIPLSYEQESTSLGAFGDPFVSIQLATGPTNGDCLKTDGNENYWDAGCSGGGGGGGGLATTTPWTNGNLAYVTGLGTVGSVATGTLTTNAPGLEFDATRGLVGGASVLSLTSGYNIPLTASTTQWAAAHASTTALSPAYIRGLFSNTATGLTYNSTTGATTLTANYVIPLTASTSQWATAYGWGNHASQGYLTNLSAFDTDDLTQGASNLYNQTHTGEVTGATTLTIADNIIEEANLEATNSPTDNYILSYDTGTGGFTWVPDATGGSPAWGTLTGTLSDQTDLQAALDAKLSTTTAASTYYLQSNPSGYISNITGLITNGTNISITGTGTSGDPYEISASGGGGGLATTTPWTAGQLAVVVNDATVKSVATSTLSENITGLEFDANPWIIGSARTLSLSSGYTIPLTASTTNWNTAYGWGNHASAGYLTTVDISSNTNLSGDTEIVLTGDALSIASTIARDTELHNAVTLAGEDFLSLSTQQITANPIDPDNLASADFGDFTCNGATCSLDATYLTEVATSTVRGMFSGTSPVSYNSGTGAFSITADSIGDTQLAFNTGQHLTTTSAPTFASSTFSNLTSALLQTTSGGLLAEYAGTSCTNQFVRSLSALGIATCASINDADWSGTDLSVANGGTGASTLSGFLFGNGTSAITGSSTITASFIQDAFLRNDGDTATGNYTFDTSTLFINAANNRIGIGTTTPLAALHVASSTNSTSTVQIGAIGSKGCLAIRDTDDAGWTYVTALDGVLSASTVACE